eukprot:1451208-Prymnesium_polylepis.1
MRARGVWGCRGGRGGRSGRGWTAARVARTLRRAVRRPRKAAARGTISIRGTARDMRQLTPARGGRRAAECRELVHSLGIPSAAGGGHAWH